MSVDGNRTSIEIRDLTKNSELSGRWTAWS